MTVTTARLRLALLLPLAFLLACQVVTHLSEFALGHDSLLGFVRAFAFRSEGNIPTWYTSLLLLSSAGAAFLCWRHGGERRLRRYWLGLVAIFLYLSLDETAKLHEQLGNIHAFVARKGMFYYSWVVPFGVLALVIGAVYLRFLFLLPPPTAIAFFAAGVLYVGGAIGMELIQAYHAAAGDTLSLTVNIITTTEELMEMCGPSLFIDGACRYLQRAGASFRLSFAAP